MNTFSIGEAIRFGWQTFKKRPGFFVWTFLALSILSSLSYRASGSADQQVGPAFILGAFVAGVLMYVISIFAKMALNTFMLKAHDAPDAVGFKEAWSSAKFWRFVLASILKTLIVGVPALILAIVGFLNLGNVTVLIACVALAIAWVAYAGVKLLFVDIILMDSDKTAVEALRESDRLSRGNFWKLVGFAFALGGVCLLGLLALVFGILVAIPVTALAYAHVYRTLQRGASAPAV